MQTDQQPAAGKGKRTIKLVLILLGILLAAFVMDNIFSFGYWGVVILILGFGLYNMYKMRDLLLNQIKYIETLMFGKPLDKDMWDKGELKIRKKKTKFVLWRKKKNVGKNREVPKRD